MPWPVVQFSKVEEFLLKLPEDARAKVSSHIVMLRQYGPFLKQPYSKKKEPKNSKERNQNCP